jgi:ribonuclease HII
MPDLRHERLMGGVVAGIDEAGRGPWAGPVVAAAVVLEPSRLPRHLLLQLDDSKKLGRRRREVLFQALTEAAHIGVGRAEVAEIDAINILAATMLAMERAFRGLELCPDAALVDGNRCPDLGRPTRCLVGGDRLSLTVAAASIVAKVTRDRLMGELALAFPGYGWERNAGYGTAEHRHALHRLGVSPHHRKSFAPIANILRSAGLRDSICCPAKTLTC